MKNLIAVCASLMALALAGCGTLAADGPYKGDKVLYIADQTDITAYKVIHAFVLFEYENRAALASHPEIKVAADDIRAHAPDLFKKYDQAREAYVIVRSPETLAAFNAAVDELKAVITKATNLLFASQTAVSK